MDVKINEFEKNAIEAVSDLCYFLGAKSVEVNIRVDGYDKSCRTDVRFSTSIAVDTARGGCGSVCKGD